jgi:hypothetical protein
MAGSQLAVVAQGPKLPGGAFVANGARVLVFREREPVHYATAVGATLALPVGNRHAVSTTNNPEQNLSQNGYGNCQKIMDLVSKIFFNFFFINIKTIN